MSERREQVIKLNERRYSMKTAAKFIGVCDMTVYTRAKKLGINSKNGLTAEDVKAILEYSRKKQRASLDELKAELGWTK